MGRTIKVLCVGADGSIRFGDLHVRMAAVLRPGVGPERHTAAAKPPVGPDRWTG